MAGSAAVEVAMAAVMEDSRRDVLFMGMMIEMIMGRMMGRMMGLASGTACEEM